MAALSLGTANPRLPRFIAFTVLFSFLAGTLWLGVADLYNHSSSVDRVRTGLWLTPGDGGGWARLAAETSGPESRTALQTAIRINPHNSSVWIALGLHAEAEGDLSEARRCLNRAVELDRGYLPLWSLANFCLRHGDRRYVPLLRDSLRVALAGGQDPVPVFDLAWQAANNAAFILADIVGTDRAALRLYVPYLTDQLRAAALIAPALTLAANRNPEDRGTLMAACETLLMKARNAEALALWNRIGVGMLNPEQGDVVTNGSLDTPSSLGFDWKFSSSPDNSLDFQGSGEGLRIEATGREPDVLDLLRQPVPVTPGCRYTLRWQAKAAPLATTARLVWILTVLDSAVPFARAAIDIDPNAEWTQGQAAVTIPPNVHFASLALRLERPLGERRFSGVVWVGKAGMQRAQ